MKIGAVAARPRANCPTRTGDPSLASTITTPHWQAVYAKLPNNVQEKFWRSERDEGATQESMFTFVWFSICCKSGVSELATVGIDFSMAPGSRMNRDSLRSASIYERSGYL